MKTNNFNSTGSLVPLSFCLLSSMGSCEGHSHNISSSVPEPTSVYAEESHLFYRDYEKTLNIMEYSREKYNEKHTIDNVGNPDLNSGGQSCFFEDVKDLSSRQVDLDEDFTEVLGKLFIKKIKNKSKENRFW